METPSLTQDSFFDGRLMVKQNADGYRFSLDPVILARHVAPAAGAKVVDLGTGCGIIPLILAFRHPDIFIDGLEIQPQLAALAQENVISNNMSARIAIHEADIARATSKIPAGGADLVICNPPFRKPSSGRINPNPERAVARHEIKTTLEAIITAAALLLKNGGEFAAVYPALRMTDIMTAMRPKRLEPKLLRMVHSRSRDPAKLVVIKGHKNGRSGLTIPAPLIIYDDNGAYTAEARQMFAP